MQSGSSCFSGDNTPLLILTDNQKKKIHVIMIFDKSVINLDWALEYEKKRLSKMLLNPSDRFVCMIKRY